jgi:predicted secreted protein
MALATTAKFSEMALHIETGTPGPYAAVCGLVGVEFTISNETADSQIPDCGDESLPHEIIRETVSTDWSASATGVWASESHEAMLQWALTGATKNVRIIYSKAAVGDVVFVTGPAILTSLSHAREKGQRITAAIQLVKAGAVTTTDQAS